MFTLNVYATGDCIGSAETPDKLPWADCKALCEYTVRRNGKAYALFDGCNVSTAKARICAREGRAVCAKFAG